jgi:hypothetical protein
MLTRARRHSPRRGNISATAVAACVLASWLAGPAQANGLLGGVPAPTAAVQQAAAPVVAAVEGSTVRSSPSPGRPAARVLETRAAAAKPPAPQPQPVEPVVTAVRSAPQAAGNTVVRTSNRVASRLEKAPDRAAAKARMHVETAVDAVRSAPRRPVIATADVSAALISSLDAVARLGTLTTPATVLAHGSQVVRHGALPTGGVTVSRGGTQPATASSADRPLFAAARPTDPGRSGSRNASPASDERAGGAPRGLSAPTTEPDDAPASAAASPAGTAAAAVAGLVVLLILASRREGTRVRLGPAWAPAAPFLPLAERPG